MAQERKWSIEIYKKLLQVIKVSVLIEDNSVFQLPDPKIILGPVVKFKGPF